MIDMEKTEKKKWSKKKKILVIVLSIIAFLLIATICAGLGVLKWYCTPVDYEVVSSAEIADSDTYLVAHRGFRAVAPENTAPAFEEAGKAGFAANECDIYRTTDGVWVVQHDKNTYRMMDLTKNIEKCTYDELMSHITDNGNNIDSYPNLKICTLEEYMTICSNYSMDAVIELKGESNQEYYNEIIDMIKKYPDVNVTFISFQFSDLEALRKVCDNELMYLVQKIEPEDIDLAKSIDNCGIDFNANKEENWENDAQIIKDCQAAGLKLGGWTVDKLEVMQKLLDVGVDMVTTNCITY